MIVAAAICLACGIVAAWLVHLGFNHWRWRVDDDGYDHAPYVCPGCHAVGHEPCSVYCVDAAIERDRERIEERLSWSDDQRAWTDEDEDLNSKH